MEMEVDEPEEIPAKEKESTGELDFESIFNLLACCKCGTVPNLEIFTLGCCTTKYCESCVKLSVGKPCHSCDVSTIAKSAVKDTFSSDFMASLRDLQKDIIISKESKELGKCSDDDEDIICTDKDTSLELPMPILTQHGKSPLVKPTVYATATRKGSRNRRGSSRGHSSKVYDFDEIEDVSTPPPKLTPHGKRTVSKTSKMKTKNANQQAMTPVTDTDSVNTTTTSRPRRKSQRMTPAAIEAQAQTSRAGRASKAETPKPKEFENSEQQAMRQLSLSPLPMDDRNSVNSPLISEPALVLDMGSGKKPGRGRGRPRSRNTTISNLSNTSICSNSPGASLPSTSFASISFTSNSSVDKRNSKGETLLHIACRSGNLDKVKNLMLAGVDVNAQDNAGWTALHETINAKKASPESKLTIVKLLCEEGLCNTNLPNQDNVTALHEAAVREYTDITGYLLSHGASPNVRNVDGKLPRDVAANKEIFNLLDETTTATGLADENEEMEIDDPVVLEIQFSKAVLYFHYELSPKTKDLVEKNLKLKIARQLGGDVTHIIFPLSDPVKRKVAFSFEYLYGIVSGVFMLGSDWIEESLSQMKIQSPSFFEIHGCDGHGTEFDENSPKRSRINKELGDPGLFHGMVFYFYKRCSFGTLAKKDLTTLVKLADGDITNREREPESIGLLEKPVRFHAKNNPKFAVTSHIVLYDEKNEPPESKKYNWENLKTLKTQWLIDSIGNFMLKDPEPYL